MSGNVVDANWTAENQRNIAKTQLMLVKGVISGSGLDGIITKYPVDNPEQVRSSGAPAVAAGHCYCGKVKLELPLDAKPSISVICHCHDCREWHSVGSLPYMMFPLDVEGGKGDEKYSIPIKMLSSPELLAFVHRTPEVRRYYAKCCGTRLFNSVYNEAIGLKLCGTFPTVFPDYEWVPTMHVNLREGNDLNYPSLESARWADLPGAFGGTGNQIPE